MKGTLYWPSLVHCEPFVLSTHMLTDSRASPTCIKSQIGKKPKQVTVNECLARAQAMPILWLWQPLPKNPPNMKLRRLVAFIDVPLRVVATTHGSQKNPTREIIQSAGCFWVVLQPKVGNVFFFWNSLFKGVSERSKKPNLRTHKLAKTCKSRVITA